MRFQSSQTTPSFLERRIQLRMLSLVGLISVLMITLSVVNQPGKPGPGDSAALTANSLDSQPYEVRREERTLKPDEFLVVPIAGDDGPRGQSPESNGRLARDDFTTDDKGFFKSRSRERTGDGQFFSRRAPRELGSNRNDVEDELRTRTVPEFDSERTELSSRPSSTFEERSSRSTEFDLSPQSEPLRSRKIDEWNSTSDSGSSESFDEISKKRNRRAPASFDDNSPTFYEFNGPVQDFKQTSGPIGPRRNSNDSTFVEFDRSDSDGDLFDAPGGQPLGDPFKVNEPLRSRKSRNIDTPDEDNVPVDRRRRSNRKSTSEAEPELFHEDFASPRIDKQYLHVVKDNTLGVRRDESEAFFWLLDHARRVSSSALEKSSLREVQYANLMNDPDRFRGEPITIEGDLWRLYEFDAGRNDYGLTRVYEGWVFTGDSGNHPYRIVFTSLPKGIEPGENLRKPVRITGYFFKRENYQSKGGVHVAPLLLARRIGINPMPNGIPLASGIVPYVIAAIMAIGLGFLVTIAGFAIGDERSSRASLLRSPRHPHLSFANLNVPTSIPVEETLKQLAERERQSAVSGAYGPLLSRQTLREHAVHDYSTSHQLAIDDEMQRHRSRTNLVHDWSARQKQSIAEEAAVRAKKTDTSTEFWSNGDDLSSDQLAPARNILPKTSETSHFETGHQFSSIPTPIHVSPINVNQSIQHTVSFGSLNTVDVSQPITPHQQSAVAHSHFVPSNHEYRASKLSEWEEEVSKLANRQAAKSLSERIQGDPLSDLANAQIERDRIAREQEIRDRIHRQNLENERLRREHLEREQLERERLERERSERATREHFSHDRASHEHHERFQNQHDHSHHEHSERVHFAHSQSDHSHTEHERLVRERLLRERLENERLERERSERERLERERIARDEHERLRLERERIDRERTLHERLEHERLERERIHHERSHTHREYDRHFESEHDHRVDGSLMEVSGDAIEHMANETGSESERIPKKRRGGWGWPRRKKTEESTSASETEQSTDSETPQEDSLTDEASSDSTSSSSGWGRSRKRRRSWRNRDAT